jgi:hypothetical protein
MKKILTIFLLAIFICSSFQAIATTKIKNDDQKIINESIIITQPEIKEEDEFLSINLEQGNSYLLEQKKPMIPILTKVYTLPFKSEIKDVDITYNGKNDIILSKSIKPANNPTPIGENIKIEKDIEIYSSSDLFPKEKFSYRTGSGLLNSEHVLFLTVKCYPLRYSPNNNILYYCDSIDIKITYNKGNYEDAIETNHDLLVISPSIFLKSLEKFENHKENYGISTYIKDVKEIYNEFSGIDKPEKIKKYIKYAIETFNISYVLLVGSLDHIPIRETAVKFHHSPINLPTDLYFSDVYDENGDFCTWDSNNNGIFGEYNFDEGNIDDVDLFADVYLGRIPCQRNLDLNIVIRKIINYEKSAYGSDWFSRILLLGGDTFPNHGIIEGEYVTSKIAEEMVDFNPTFLWTSKNTFNLLRINSETTKGAGFISYSGHGYIHGFGTSPPNVEKRIQYYDWYLPGMLNRNKLPIVFFDACLTATLDYKLFDILNFPGIAYNLVKKPIGGAVASIGATRVAFTNVDFEGIHGGAGYLNLHFFMNYEEGISLSEMFTKSQNDYINYVFEDCITLEEFILIGDPSLKTGGYPQY